jgi:anti-anti-sigma regulatory factor
MRTWLDIQRPRSAAANSWRPSGVVDIALYGRLSMLTVAAQEKAVAAIIFESQDDVLLDLTNIVAVSATGVQMVCMLQALLAEHDRRLVVVAPQPQLLLQLGKYGLSTFVEVYPSRALALGLSAAA